MEWSIRMHQRTGATIPQHIMQLHYMKERGDLHSFQGQLRLTPDTESAKAHMAREEDRRKSRRRIQTKFFTTEYAADITAVQSRAILDDSFEMRAAYLNSSVEDASIDLNSSSSEDPATPEPCTQATPDLRPLQTDYTSKRSDRLDNS
jgi:hypothetical protein